LLLKYSQAGGAFQIVSGYDIGGTQVYLLDGVVKGSGGYSLQEYGKPPAGFLADVTARIAAAGK
jgi:hypothetical protein